MAAIYVDIKGSLLPFFYAIPFVVSILYSTLAFSRITLPFGKTCEKSSELLKEKFTKILSTSLPMLGSTIGFTVISTVDILMLNNYHSSDAAGVYSIYIRLLLVITIVVNSANSLLAPQLSKLFHSNRHDDLKQYAKRSTLMVFALCSVPAIILFLFDENILRLFGEEFQSETIALHLLILGIMINAFFGATGFFLNMTNHEKEFFVIMFLAAFVNIIFNILLIPSYKAIGAALSSLLTICFWNIASTLLIKKKCGYTLIYTSKIQSFFRY